MRIKTIAITNFRSLQNIEVEFDSITTFIGPNGTGKSTVLRALDWFFNGSKNGDLTNDDCSFGSVGEPIEVQVTFFDLSAEDRETLGKYAIEGIDRFTAWKTRSPSGEETLSANAKGFPAFTAIRNATSAAQKKELYKSLREQKSELELPLANTGPQIDEALSAWEAENSDKLENVPEVQTNFFGFNSNSKMSGLFDFVLVTADLRAGEESQDSKSTIIGRILEKSVDRTAADEQVAQIVERSRIEQQRVYASAFETQLNTITHDLNSVVSGYTPGRIVTVKPSEVELKAPRTTFQVSVLDGETETPVDRQGHGFQRTLLISALQMLAQSGAAGDNGVICLAIEEPELYQHPIQAQSFAKILRTLAEDRDKQIQVTYATHSPYFVEAQKFHQVRRMTRSLEKIPKVSAHSATLDNVVQQLSGVINEDSVKSQLDGTISNQLATAIFAERALLVEGTTESAVLYGIGDKDGVGSFEASGLSIVPVSGKMNIPLSHAILSSIGVPVYVMFDADAGFEARATKNGKSKANIEKERASHAAANRKLLKYFGLPEADFPDQTIASNVTILTDHLESLLENEWPEWRIALLELEKQTGISAKKNQEAYRTVTQRAGGSLPSCLLEAINKAQCR